MRSGMPLFKSFGSLPWSLTIYNSLSGKKEPFAPIAPPRVRIYNCGITPHDVSHLGHGTAAIRVNMIRRYLKHAGYDVTFVQNVTDVDDKIIARSKILGIPVTEVAERFSKEFTDSQRDLGITAPDHEPKVSEYIPQIIAYVERLVAKGAAYATADGDVYFAVEHKADYGKLSNRRLAELMTGTRDLHEGAKRHPADFALWKADDTPGASWPSPWGLGRPGWHIECSVMSNDLLGAHFDIHCGGLDLLFPHHENELAQCEAHNDCPFVNFWVHVGLLNVDGTKMSKSLGNFISLREGIEKYGPELLTFATIKHHYRSAIDFSDRLFHESLNNLCEYYEAFEALGASGAPQAATPATALLDRAFDEAMSEDFNTTIALQVILNELRGALKGADAHRAEVGARARHLGQILGLFRSELTLEKVRVECLKFQTAYLKRPALTPEDIARLIEERAEARRSKNFARSDEIRKELLASGVTLLDASTGGTTWQFAVTAAK